MCLCVLFHLIKVVCFLFLFFWAEGGGVSEAIGEAKAGIEVYMDGEEHWSSS